MSIRKPQPLDFVRTSSGNMALVTEVNSSGDSSIIFLEEGIYEKSAWWSYKELEIINTLPNLLAKGLAHPFGSASLQPFNL